MGSARSRKCRLTVLTLAAVWALAAAEPSAPPPDSTLVPPPMPVYEPPTGVPGPREGPANCAPAAQCVEVPEGLFDNLSVFAGLQGAKEPQDLGINANFGIRGHFNWGIPLWQEYGLGAQIGSSVNWSDNAVRVLKSIDGVTDRTQNFNTVGLFQRTDLGFEWGIAYDILAEDYYQEFTFRQWRGQVGYYLNSDDEIGLWGTVSDSGTEGLVDKQAFHLSPINQGYVFWRHIWPNDALTRIWVGVAAGHGRFLLVSPGETSVHHPIAFGADLWIPLSEHIALFGEANFITPNDTGTVTATLGFAWTFGPARNGSRSRFAPMFAVADNPTFAVDLHQ